MQVALCLHFVACVFSLVPLLHLCTLLGKKHANKNVNKCGKKNVTIKRKHVNTKLTKKQQTHTATVVVAFFVCFAFCVFCCFKQWFLAPCIYGGQRAEDHKRRLLQRGRFVKHRTARTSEVPHPAAAHSVTRSPDVHGPWSMSSIRT